MNPVVTIEDASPAQLAELISIHRQALPETFNSRLGPEHLTYLYTRLLAHPDSLLAAARLDGKLAGMVCATLNVEKLSAWLTAELTPAGWARYGLRILARPSLWLSALESLNSSQVLRQGGETISTCLTVLAVAPQARRQGLGQALVRKVDDFVRTAGLACYWLETDATNRTALAFYTHLGFRQVGRRRHALRLVRSLEAEGAAWLS